MALVEAGSAGLDETPTQEFPMRHSYAIGLLALALAGCATDYNLTAEDQLTLSAIGGQEDPVTIGAFDEDSSSEDQKGPQPGPIGRECDAAGDYAALFDRYDADRSQRLEKGECDEVDADHAAHPRQAREDLIEVLTLVYDDDADGALSDGERATLLDDFTVRCETLQGRMLEEHDADEDGALSDMEREGACDDQRAENEEMRGELEGQCPPPPREGDTAGPPPEGVEPPPEGSSCFVDSLVAEFDVDRDGALSEAEREQLQLTVRQRILDGQRLHAAPF